MATPPGLNPEHSSQLKVVSTNQCLFLSTTDNQDFPKTYYPQNDYNVDITYGTHPDTDDVNAFLARKEINKSI